MGMLETYNYEEVSKCVCVCACMYACACVRVGCTAKWLEQITELPSVILLCGYSSAQLPETLLFLLCVVFLCELACIHAIHRSLVINKSSLLLIMVYILPRHFTKQPIIFCSMMSVTPWINYTKCHKRDFPQSQPPVPSAADKH